MSQGPGGGGDSHEREDRPPAGGQEGRDIQGNGPESTGGGAENGGLSSTDGERLGGAGGGGTEGSGADGGGAGGSSGAEGGAGGGDTYDLYQRGLDLLSRGSAAAAAQLLTRAHTFEPGSRSVLEALARAQFDARRYGDAADSFRQIVDQSPADDYAQFGLGLSLARTGNPRGAAEHLALAAAMRPDLRHYSDALRGVRATLKARREAGLPDEITPGSRPAAPGGQPSPGVPVRASDSPGRGGPSGPGSQPGPGDPPGPGSSAGSGRGETGAA
jgi:hypothetical protein